MTRPYKNQQIEKKKKKKKRTSKIVDFAVPADHRIKLKENEKKDKYLNLAKELKKKHNKKLWNRKVSTIPIVIVAFSTVTTGLSKGVDCPVSWGCRIHRLLLCRGVRPLPTSVPDMTIKI